MARKSEQKERDDSKDLRGGPGKYSRKLSAFWVKNIEEVEKLEEPWHKRGDEIIRRFRDDRKKADIDLRRQLNVLWANYKILMPALYGKPPVPVIERRYLQRDPVARLSATILERNTKFQLEINNLHNSIKRAVADYLLPGRGVVWVRYEPEIGEGDSIPVQTEGGFEDELDKIEKEFGKSKRENDEQSEKLENTGEQIIAEQAPVDYIDWKDFLMFPKDARTWDEVQAIGKKVYISRKEAKQRFGKEIGEKLQPDTSPQDGTSGRTQYTGSIFARNNEDRNILVYEIWNKTDRRVYWVSKGYDYLCDIKDDFLNLKKFFPVPEPISATITNDSLIPVPDYWEYQDQAIQIDEITQRLALLTKACKVAGTYDSSNGALKRLLKEGFENDLLPVDSWAVFAEKGGVKGGISLLPIDEIQKVIQTLQVVRQQLMQDLDLITGITDINRGTTDSRETLGGIRLKNNNTGTRLSDRQNEVARFAKDTIAIVAEIAAKHFTDKTLIQASGVLFDDDMQPDAIMSDMKSEQPQQPQSIPGMPPMGAPQPMPQMPVGGPPMGAPGMMAPMMGQPPQNNVIQFPQQPNMQQPMAPQMPMMPQMMMPQQTPIDPQLIIMQRIEKALDLIRKEVPLGYRIDIETDSTIFGDAAEERKDATEFITGAMGFLQQAAALAENVPEFIPLAGRMLQWGVRKFRVGRDIEGAFDSFVQKMDKKAKELEKNPQPNPEQQKASIEMQKAQMEMENQKQQNAFDMQKTQAEHQMDQQAQQHDFQVKQAEDQRKAQIEQQKMNNEMAIAQMELAMEKEKHQMEMQKMGMQQQVAQQDHQMQLHEHQLRSNEMMQTHNIKQQEMAQGHQVKMEQMNKQAKLGEATHKTKMEQMKHQAKEKDKARKDKSNQPKKSA